MNECAQKDVLLFDLDGTLTDPKEGITKSIQYALRTFGIETNNLDALTPFIGPPLKHSFMHYYRFTESEAENAIKAYREYYAAQGIYENALYEGIPELLTTLREKKKTLLVATSKPVVFAERVLHYFRIRDYFMFVSGSGLDGTQTNKADVIRSALAALPDAPLETALMIGDRKHDIEGAKTVGIESVGVGYGYGTREELENAGASYIVDTLRALSTLLIP